MGHIVACHLYGCGRRTGKVVRIKTTTRHKNLKKYFKVRSGFSTPWMMSLTVTKEKRLAWWDRLRKSTLGKTILRLVEPTSGRFSRGENIVARTMCTTGRQVKMIKTPIRALIPDEYRSVILIRKVNRIYKSEQESTSESTE